MKPFDLEAAKRGEPICTRDGRDVLWFAYCEKAKAYPVVAFVAERRGLLLFSSNGELVEGNKSENDLFMKSRKRTVYVNVWREDDFWGAEVYTRKESAINRGTDGNEHFLWKAIAVPIEIEE